MLRLTSHMNGAEFEYKRYAQEIRVSYQGIFQKDPGMKQICVTIRNQITGLLMSQFVSIMHKLQRSFKLQFFPNANANIQRQSPPQEWRLSINSNKSVSQSHSSKHDSFFAPSICTRPHKCAPVQKCIRPHNRPFQLRGSIFN